MKKFIFKILILIFILLFILFSIILGLGYLKYKNATYEISLTDKIQEIRNQDNFTKLEDISENYKNAVVSVEDHRFYNHKGVDYFSLFHSTYVNIKSKSLDYGASTITQQVRKAFIFFSRKVCYKKSRRNICSLQLRKKLLKR